MKLKLLLNILFFTSLLIVMSSSMMYPGGAPAAKTGSPGDGASCSQCHGQTATTTAGLITTNIPPEGYTAGQTYQITATNSLTGSGKYGFEVSPQNIAGTQLGTLVAGTGSKLVGGTKYVTQSNANSTTHTWTFGWIAPVTGTGAVTFYGAFARNYSGPTTLSTLTIQEAASLPAPAGPITGPAAICINSTENYSITTIPGATSYVWTVPAGATLAGGQGTTSVSVTFSTSAISGNISVYGTNSVGNGSASNLAVSVNTIPSATVAPEGPAQVDLHNSLTTDYVASLVADTYTWQLNPVVAGTITGNTATAQVTWNTNFTGYAEISFKAQNLCGESGWSPVKTTQVLNTTGIAENVASINVIAESDGNLKFITNTDANSAKVTVLDLSGRMMFKAKIPGQGTQLIRCNLKPGIYFVLVESGSIRLTKKILVS